MPIGTEFLRAHVYNLRYHVPFTTSTNRLFGRSVFSVVSLRIKKGLVLFKLIVNGLSDAWYVQKQMKTSNNKCESPQACGVREEEGSQRRSWSRFLCATAGVVADGVNRSTYSPPPPQNPHPVSWDCEVPLTKRWGVFLQLAPLNLNP